VATTDRTARTPQVCRSRGNLGDHTCPPGGVQTGRILGGYLDARVGQIRQWALVLDCDAHGCPTRHSDADEFRPIWGIDDPGEQIHRATISGHAARVVTRIIDLPPWQDHQPTT